MRESIGGTWTLQIVIVFILFFVAFITLTINYTRAFRVKNEIINIIEREEGFTPSTADPGARYLVASYLNNNGYQAKGKCDVGTYGISSISLNDASVESSFEKIDDSKKNNKYYYCLKKIKNPIKGVSEKEIEKYNYKNRAYYEVTVFFKFNLPVIGDLTTFSVHGETNDVYFNADGLEA